MEYCAGGDMSMFIRSKQRLSEARVRPFVQQIGKTKSFQNHSHLIVSSSCAEIPLGKTN